MIAPMCPVKPEKSVAVLFKEKGAAEHARAELLRLGYSRENIFIFGPAPRVPKVDVVSNYLKQAGYSQQHCAVFAQARKNGLTVFSVEGIPQEESEKLMDLLKTDGGFYYPQDHMSLLESDWTAAECEVTGKAAICNSRENLPGCRKPDIKASRIRRFRTIAIPVGI